MQGVGNIVQNAVSFARRDVLIVTRWTAAWSEVEVSDDGPGFSDALLDELGTPFISTRQGEEGPWDWVSSSPRRYWNEPGQRDLR